MCHSDHPVTVEHEHQEHEAVEVLEIVLALGGHNPLPPSNLIAYAKIGSGPNSLCKTDVRI